MAIQLDRHIFTLEEYERMVEAGVFEEDARVELIRGEIVETTPMGFPHEMCVARLSTLLTRLVGDAALVWPQNNSIRVLGNSRPQPDFTLLKWRGDYSSDKPPTGQDVILVVEVSDTTLTYDRNVKGPLYAEAGIPEYWIVNLQEDLIELYADPAGGAFRHTAKAKRGETLTLLTLPDLLKGNVEANDILGSKVKR